MSWVVPWTMDWTRIDGTWTSSFVTNNPTVPSNAITTDANDPITTDAGDFITTD